MPIFSICQVGMLLVFKGHLPFEIETTEKMNKSAGTALEMKGYMQN